MSEVVSLVACGPSAIDCGARSAPGYVVAINGAFDHVLHDAVLTMDGRFAAERWRDLRNEMVWCRRKAFDKIPPRSDEFEFWDLFDCDHTSTEFSDSTRKLNGSNSGYCALNLAYALKPKTVFLYGYDMAGEHFFGRYAWHGQGSVNHRVKFQIWANEMHAARKQFDAAGIRVINTNPKSAIDAFEFGTP